MSKTQKRYAINYRGTYFNGKDWGKFEDAKLMTLSRANSVAKAMNSNDDLQYWTVIIDVTELRGYENA